jgi:hypothetical protein
MIYPKVPIALALAALMLVGAALGGSEVAQQFDTDRLTVDDGLLKNLLPKVKAPRLMRLDDLLDDWERRNFVTDGLTFILEGDYDRDGKQDYAVAGKDDSLDPNLSAFILILTVKQGRPVVMYFRHLRIPRLSLLLQPNCYKGFDGIGLVQTPRSDHGAYLTWDGAKYSIIRICENM